MNLMPEPSPNAAQVEYWNTAAGKTWAAFHEQLDRQVEPLGLAAMAVLAPRPGEHILDIGCGCGQTSLALAARVRPSGTVVAVDISEPMLDVARHRPRSCADLQLAFRKLDAQTGDLGHGVFDAAFSRFGVMFFSDPVAAFANIRASLKPGGRLAFVCWRPLNENPWMHAPLQAALPFLPPAVPPDPTAPGPFAFANASRVRAILADAGFAAVTIDPFDAVIGGSDVAQSLQLALTVGPLGRALRENPELVDNVTDAVRDLLSKHLMPDGVRMAAAVWIVLAHTG
jgi:SAM-dependent methyltransferase